MQNNEQKPPAEEKETYGERCPLCGGQAIGEDIMMFCTNCQTNISGPGAVQRTGAKRAILRDGEVIYTTDQQKSSGCFIATVCYGTADCMEVLTLQQFRDETLISRYWGRILMSVYYWCSPPLAARIRHHPLIKRIIRRFVIMPIVRAILYCRK